MLAVYISIIYIRAHTLKTNFRKSKRPLTMTETRTRILDFHMTMRYHRANGATLNIYSNYNIDKNKLNPARKQHVLLQYIYV